MQQFIVARLETIGCVKDSCSQFIVNIIALHPDGTFRNKYLITCGMIGSNGKMNADQRLVSYQFLLLATRFIIGQIGGEVHVERARCAGCNYNGLQLTCECGTAAPYLFYIESPTVAEIGIVRSSEELQRAGYNRC